MPTDAIDAAFRTTPRAASGPNPREFARLLFMTFIHLADGERDMTPQEVRCLNKLTANLAWTSHAGMRSALQSLGANYSEFWASYETKTLVVDRRSLSAQLRVVSESLSIDEAAALRGALRDFVGRFEPGALSAMLRVGGINTPQRARARAEIAEIFAARQEAQANVAKSGAPKAGGAGPGGPEARISAAGTAAGIAGGEAAAAEAIVHRDLPRPEGGGGGAHRINFGLPAWVRGRTAVRCVSVRDETTGVKSFSFVTEPACLFHFQPGQFVTFELPIGGATVRRSYTISSSPSRPHLLTVTVKRGIDGYVSAWLHDNMRPGQECMINGPHGDFHCAPGPGQRLLLISAGSGVTPMMSMLRYFADTAPNTDIVFINCVRTPSEIIFEQELLYLSGVFGPALKMIILPAGIRRGQIWHGLVGRMDPDLLTTLAPDFLEREAFVCGPAGFMDAVRDILGTRGHPPERFRQESFGGTPPRPAAPRPAETGAAETGVVASSLATTGPAATGPAASASASASTVRFTVSSIVVRGGPDETLLDIAETNGVPLASSCRSGTCGTCKLRVTSGTALMDAQSVLSDEEVAEGYVLSCMTRLSGEVVVDA